MKLGLSPVLVLAVSAVACSTQTTEEEASGDAPSSNEAAVSGAAEQLGCSHERYVEGKEAYDTAIADAKRRLRTTTCNDDTALWMITLQLMGAIVSCEGFKTLVAYNDEAKPIRDAFAGNLGLAVLSGKIDEESLAGLPEALPGTTMYGVQELKTTMKLKFEGNGKATLARLRVASDGTKTWPSVPAKWSLLSPKKIVIEADGRTMSYDVSTNTGRVYFGEWRSNDYFDNLPDQCPR